VTDPILKDDYQVFDFRENVTVKFLKHGGSGTEIADISALRRPLTKRDRDFLGIGVDSNQIHWELFDTLITPNQPKPSDIITAGSELWIIRSAERIAAGETWRCLAELRPA